jgi:predicted anti-sigma-YlaC factor YlaD
LRAREYASLRLDEQLTELETARLQAHLLRCSDCRASAASMTAATEALRAAPLEPVSLRFELPRRRVGLYALRAASVAAAASVALISFQFQTGGSRSAASPIRVDRALLGLKEQQLAALDAAPARTISPGIAAAERTTVGTPVEPEPHLRRFPPR